MDKPLGCPFCGSDAKVLSLHTIHEINCTGCHACLWREGYNEAIAAWNRRAPVEWTVTRVKANDVLHEYAADQQDDGYSTMTPSDVVEALGGKVEG